MQAVPDMIVHNVIKGKRYISWSGEVTITCPESGSPSISLSLSLHIFFFSRSYLMLCEWDWFFLMFDFLGYTATISTKDKNRVNIVSGYIVHYDDLDKKYPFSGFLFIFWNSTLYQNSLLTPSRVLPLIFHSINCRMLCRLWEFEGICGEKSFIYKPGDEANKKLLFDCDTFKLPYIYYLPVRFLIGDPVINVGDSGMEDDLSLNLWVFWRY